MRLPMDAMVTGRLLPTARFICMPVPPQDMEDTPLHLVGHACSFVYGKGDGWADKSCSQETCDELFTNLFADCGSESSVSASDRHIADFFSSEVIPAFFLAVNSSGAADLQVREHRQTMLTSWPWKSRPAEKSIHGWGGIRKTWWIQEGPGRDERHTKGGGDDRKEMSDTSRGSRREGRKL